MQFSIACRAPRANSACPLDAANSVARFRFLLASSSFCAQVVDSIGLSATLASYLESARSTPKDDFLDAQVAYFRLSVTSDKASIFRTALWELSVVKTAVESSTVLLTHDLMNGGANTALGNSYGLVSSFGGAAAVGEESAVLFQLVVKTGAAHLNLVQDEVVKVALIATVRVQYENAGQVSVASNDDGHALVETRGFVGELAAVGMASASVAHSLAARSGPREAGEASTSFTSGTSGISTSAFVGIVVAVSALVVIVVAVVMVRLNRVSPAEGESDVQPMTTTRSEADMVGEVGTTCTTPFTVKGMTMREVVAAYEVGSDGAGVV